ncbi:MAG TPA: PQQ-binding-like beta-propeller repeat protein, partial [Actinomycetota bacterium]
DQVTGVNERCPTWAGAYNHTGRGGRGEDIGRDLAVSPDGTTVYITGQSQDDVSGDDQAIVAFDAATGALRWASRYTQSGNSFDTGSGLAVAPDGSRVYAVGRSIGADGSWDWVTAAYRASDGLRLWESRYETALSDRTWAVEASPDGSAVFVVGEVNGADVGAAAYDAATGELLWDGVYDGGGTDWALQIGVAPDGETVYAAGTSGAATTGVDLVTVAFRAVPEGDDEAGSVRWASRVDGGDRGPEIFGGFDLAPDGETLAIAGYTTVGGVSKTLTAVVDAASGAERWRGLAAGGAADSDMRDTVAIGGGRVVRVTRDAGPTGENSQYVTIAYDLADGSVDWTATQGGGPNMKDHAKTVAFSPDEARVFVSGYSVFPYGETGGFRIEPGHIMTVSYDAASGARRWVALHNQSGVGADFAVGVVPSPNGQRVFVGGTFITSGTHVWASDATMAYAYDFGVVAYPA